MQLMENAFGVMPIRKSNENRKIVRGADLTVSPAH
jgi:hypothetical protein